jgi:murein DD-endopeptidase MepM/ murein hydrolase activator NlpD
MIKNRSVCSPSPDGDSFSNQHLLSLFKKQKATISFCLTLLCLLLSTGTVSAQTRPLRAGAQSDERVRRAEDQAQTNADESGPRSDAQKIVQPSQVRKTALVYPTRAGNQSADRPALVNDIVIISRAEETSPARRLTARKTGASIPSIWPVVGPLRSGVGVRSNPFGGSSLEYHKGQDIAAPTGTPVKVTADGVVMIAGWVRGYGNGIYVDHGNGITTRYGHLSRIDVVVGQTVKQGEQIGLVGSTGRSTGPHLHYEVRINGEPTSPLLYLPSVPTMQEMTEPSSPARGARQ